MKSNSYTKYHRGTAIALYRSMKTLNIKNAILPILMLLAYCGGGGTQSDIWLNTNTKGLLAPNELLLDCVASGNMNISWAAVDTTATDFQIERSDDGFAYTLIDQIPAVNAEYSDLTVSNGHTYLYRLRAVIINDDGVNYVSDYVSSTAITTSVVVCGGIDGPVIDGPTDEDDAGAGAL